MVYFIEFNGDLLVDPLAKPIKWTKDPNEARQFSEQTANMFSDVFRYLRAMYVTVFPVCKDSTGRYLRLDDLVITFAKSFGLGHVDGFMVWKPDIVTVLIRGTSSRFESAPEYLTVYQPEVEREVSFNDFMDSL